MTSDLDFFEQATEQDEERRQEEIKLRQRRSRIAKKIFMDADIMEIFSDIEAEHHAAFDNMGYGATLEEYQTVHFSLMAITQLKARLNGYILVNEMAEESTETDKNLEDVQI